MAKKNKGGRPSPFDNIDMKQVEKLAVQGWTDVQMADFFGVTEQTWTNWKNSKPKFFGSLKNWKVAADARVERTLYERATGYSHPEDKVFNDNGTALIVPTIKHYPPDTTAAIFWLKNRQPKEWRDKKEFTGDISLEQVLAATDKKE